MSNTVNIQSFLDSQVSMFLAVDEALNELKGEGCLQFPILLSTVALKMNWDAKTLRENDPIIRQYIRSNPDWYVTRGAHGGIMKASDKQKKDALIAAKKKAKEEVSAAIDAQVAAQTAPIATDTVEDNTNTITE
jgi:hypothetical protein